MDHDRLWNLIDKLSTTQPETCFRAVSSLAFKISTGLVELSEPAILKRLLDGIAQLLGNHQLFPNPEDLIKNALLVLAGCTGASYSRDSTSGTKFDTDIVDSIKILVDKLNRLKENTKLPPSLLLEVDSSIHKLCELQQSSPKRLESNTTTIDVDSRGIYRDSVSTLDAKLSGTQSIKAPTALANGAGAILYSRLCFYGRHLESVVLTDVDDKYLFDLEVKLKLRHESCGEALAQAFDDFPAAVIFQRPAILFNLLSVIGEPFSQVDIDVNPDGIHAVSVVAAIIRLLQRAEQEVYAQVEASYCAQSVDENEHQPTTEVEKLTNFIHRLRYPCMERDPFAVFSPHAGAPPIPSISGLAFAVVAATLPLLQSRDAMAFAAVQQLAASAFDLVLEPVHEESAASLEINRQRCQHLALRFDQLLTIYAPSLECMNSDGFELASLDFPFLKLWVDFLVHIFARQTSTEATSSALLHLPKTSWDMLTRILVNDRFMVAIGADRFVHSLEQIIHRQDPEHSQIVQALRMQVQSMQLIEHLHEDSPLEVVVDALERLFPLYTSTSTETTSLLHLQDFVVAVVFLLERCGQYDEDDGKLALQKRVHMLLERIEKSTLAMRIAFFLKLRDIEHTTLECWMLQPKDMLSVGLTCLEVLNDEDTTDLEKLLSLLGTLCELCKERMAADRLRWKAVMAPLRAILFAIPKELTVVSSASKRHLDHLEEFIHVLETSNDAALVDEVVASLACGLFHHRVASRVEASLLLAKALHIDFPSNDPLRDIPELVLEDFVDKLPKELKVKEPTFSHADVRRLVSIAESSALDDRVRGAALEQLFQLLQNDRSLLHTCPETFVLHAVQVMVSILRLKLCGHEEQQINFDLMASLDSNGWTLIGSVLTVLTLFIRSFPHMELHKHLLSRSSVGFYLTDLLVSCAVNSERVLKCGQSREMTLRALFLSWKCLHLIIFHPQRWSMRDDPLQSSKLPVFFVRNFGAPSLRTADYKVQLPTTGICWPVGDDSAACDSSFHPFDGWTDVFESASRAASSSLDLCQSSWRAVDQALQQCATIHDQSDCLRRCTVIARCLHFTLSSQSRRHNGLVVSVMQRVCSWLPMRDYDDSSFSIRGRSSPQQLALLRDGLAALAGLLPHWQGEWSVLRKLLEDVLGRLYSLMISLREESPLVLVRVERMAAVLLKAILRAKPQHSLELGHLSSVLAMLWESSFSTSELERVYSEVLVVFELLISLPDGPRYLFAHVHPNGRTPPTEEGMRDREERHWTVWSHLLRTVRTPDSFRGDALVSHAMRVLQHLLRFSDFASLVLDRPDCQLWQWISRKLIDRRAAMKVLALEIFIAVPRSVTLSGQEDAIGEMVRDLCACKMECSRVRALALTLLVRLPSLRGDGADVLDRLVGCVRDLLREGASMESVHAVRALKDLVMEDVSYLMPLLRRDRIFARIVHELSGEAFQRAMRTRSARFWGLTDQSPAPTTSVPIFMPKYIHRYFHSIRPAVEAFIHAAERLLLQTYHDAPIFFQETMRHSAFAAHLVASLASAMNADDNAYEEGDGMPMFGLRVEALQLITRFDLLALYLRLPDVPMIEQRPALLCAFRAFLLVTTHLRQLGSEVVSLLVASLARYLLLFLDTAQRELDQMDQVLVRVFKAIVRLRIAMLEISAGDGSDWPSNALDGLVAVMMQRVTVCGDLFCHRVRSAETEAALLDYYLQVIADAASALDSPTPTVSSAPSTRSHRSTGQSTWRQRTRGFAWQPPTSTSASATMSKDSPSTEPHLNSMDRAKAYGALVVLTASLPRLMDALSQQKAAQTIGSLQTLHERSLGWSITTHLVASSPQGVGSISEGRLAGAVQAAVAAVLGQSEQARRLFLQSYKPRARLLNSPSASSAGGAGGGGGVPPSTAALHRLLAVGLFADNQPPALRNVALHCVSLLLPLALPAGGLRAEVTRQCAQRLQALMTESNPDPVAAYFTTATFSKALLLTSAGPSCYDRGGLSTAHSKEKPTAHPLLSFAELAKVLAATPGARLALCRALAGAFGNHGDGSNVAEDLLPLVAQRVVLAGLLQCTREEEVRAEAVLCVKALVRGSEKARGLLRQTHQEMPPWPQDPVTALLLAG